MGIQWEDYIFNGGRSCDISEEVSLVLNSLADLAVDQLLDDFFQQLFVDAELHVASLLGQFEKLLEGAVHLMVVSML